MRVVSLKNSFNLFTYLLLLTFIFLLAELSFFIQCNQIYFADFHVIAARIPIPRTILPGIFFFLAAHALIHLSYAAIIGLITLLTAPYFRKTPAFTLKWGVTLWLIGILSVMVSNQYLFPNSKFAELSRVILPETLLPILYAIFCGFWLLLLVLSLFSLLRFFSFRGFLLLCFCSAMGGLYWGYQQYGYESRDGSTLDRPNIIIIGVDSLRPDFVTPQFAPFISAFLNQASVFTQTFTPLARTYPSWMGILSGLYPKESGIRFNLAKAKPETLPPLLSTQLQKQGYRTLYGTDETQFSNIDQQYGFDEAVTPTMGLNNFLLGTFNDFPLSNLLVNTTIGKFLFPNSYANRPAYMTYDPDSFLDKLKPYLKESRDRPLFLAVHFCLTHYPYVWKSYSTVKDKDPLSRYQAAIGRVDQQVGDLLGMLEKFHILRHALIVLLSDHGEALELSGDRITSANTYVPLKEGKRKIIPRFYPPSADKEKVNQSAGHGTDVLGFSQYHSLLAFRLYGLQKQRQGNFSNYVLLLDIKPTVLDFLKIADKSSGISLKELILGETSSLPSRAFFMESDFSPEAIRSAHPETRNLVFEGIEVFTIDPESTRIFVKESMGKLIISSKQVARVDQNWVLALYPQPNGKMMPVLVHIPTGRWTTDLGTAFAQNSPQKKMLDDLKKFYGKEIKQLTPPS